TVPTVAAAPAPVPMATTAKNAPPETNSTTAAEPPRRSRSNTNDPIARIRDEGLNRSQAMDALSYLTDVIGPRLTGSPQMKRANEWTKTKLESWGMTNAKIEPWGPFGRGWSLE